MDRSARFRLEFRRTGIALLGVAMYAVGVNLFVVPAGFFNGGLMGFCQLLRALLVRIGLLTDSFDASGIFYYLFNIPILILAWVQVDKRFVLRTLFSVTVMTILLSIIPTRSLIGTDSITSCLVGGLVAGAGTGLLLRAGSTGGGLDVVGLMITHKHRDFSVGRVNMAVNIVLYALFLIFFDVQTALYSAIYSAVYSLALDRMHYQNINEEIIVLTKQPVEELKQEILNTVGRGVTTLDAHGGFTGEPVTMLFIVASKYETLQLRQLIYRHDPRAFVTVKEHTTVYGNFERHL